MSDEHPTDRASRLDALETALGDADPADAPAIAEEIADVLSDALDSTQKGNRAELGRGSPDTVPETAGESPS